MSQLRFWFIKCLIWFIFGWDIKVWAKNMVVKICENRTRTALYRMATFSTFIFPACFFLDLSKLFMTSWHSILAETEIIKLNLGNGKTSMLGQTVKIPWPSPYFPLSLSNSYFSLTILTLFHFPCFPDFQDNGHPAELLLDDERLEISCRKFTLLCNKFFTRNEVATSPLILRRLWKSQQSLGGISCINSNSNLPNTCQNDKINRIRFESNR